MQTFKPTAKLQKIEKRAWKAFNVEGKSMFTKVMTDLKTKWENEVIAICGEFNCGRVKMTVIDETTGEPYSYNFGDIIA